MSILQHTHQVPQTYVLGQFMTLGMSLIASVSKLWGGEYRKWNAAIILELQLRFMRLENVNQDRRYLITQLNCAYQGALSTRPMADYNLPRQKRWLCGLVIFTSRKTCPLCSIPVWRLSPATGWWLGGYCEGVFSCVEWRIHDESHDAVAAKFAVAVRCRIVQLCELFFIWFHLPSLMWTSGILHALWAVVL
jgi:hypothetical protein